MAASRIPKPESAGNARTVVVALAAVAVGAIGLSRGLPDSSGPTVVAGATNTSTTRASGTPASSTTLASTASSAAAGPATTVNVGASKVVVANGAQIDGVAGRMTKILQQKGYVTIDPTNAEPAAASSVFFVPGFQPVAEKVAADLAIKTVAAMPATKPVDTKDGVILVLLGADFKESAVPGGSQLAANATSAATTATSAALPATALTAPAASS